MKKLLITIAPVIFVGIVLLNFIGLLLLGYFTLEHRQKIQIISQIISQAVKNAQAKQ